MDEEQFGSEQDPNFDESLAEFSGEDILLEAQEYTKKRLYIILEGLIVASAKGTYGAAKLLLEIATGQFGNSDASEGELTTAEQLAELGKLYMNSDEKDPG